MAVNLKTFKTFYFLVGLSWKNYSKDKNVRENRLAVWSYFATAILLTIVACLTYGQLSFTHTCWQATIQMCVRCFTLFTTCVILLWSPLKRNEEEAFWKILANAGSVDQNEKTRFIKTTAFKLMIMLASLVFQFLIMVTAFLLNRQNQYAKVGVYIFTNIAVCRLFRLKFIFFMDVFNFHLKHLTSKCGRHDKQKNLKLSISICWKLIQILENIFGFPILLNWMVLFNATILNFFNVYMAIDRRFFTILPLYTSALSTFEIFFIADACQKCITTVSKIRSKIFRRKGKVGHVEVLILKLHHENIKFDTKNVIDVDRKFINAVSVPEN